MQRNEELFKKNFIPVPDKDELETQTRVAELDVKQQHEVLTLRIVVSPLNGVVIESARSNCLPDIFCKTGF